MKSGWRILIDKFSICARIMRDKYVRDNNFSELQKRMEIQLCGKK